MSADRSKLFINLAGHPLRGRVVMTKRIAAPRQNLHNQRKHAVFLTSRFFRDR